MYQTPGIRKWEHHKRRKLFKWNLSTLYGAIYIDIRPYICLYSRSYIFFVYDAWKIRKELFRYFRAAFSFGINWAADKYIALGEITRKHFMSIKNLSLYIFR